MFFFFFFCVSRVSRVSRVLLVAFFVGPSSSELLIMAVASLLFLEASLSFLDALFGLCLFLTEVGWFLVARGREMSPLRIQFFLSS